MKKKRRIAIWIILAVLAACILYAVLSHRSPVYSDAHEGNTVTFKLDYDTDLYQYWTGEYDQNLLTFVSEATEEIPNAKWHFLSPDMRHTFLFEARQPGMSIVKFTLLQLRSGGWEVYKTKTYGVQIDSDGSISSIVSTIGLKEPN